MNLSPHSQPRSGDSVRFGDLTPSDYEVMVDLAKRRAREARQEALQDFGRHFALPGDLIRSLWRAARSGPAMLRSQSRLHHALNRHHLARKQGA